MLQSPTLIFRDVTERQEALDIGVAELMPTTWNINNMTQTIRDTLVNGKLKPMVETNPFMRRINIGNICAGLIMDWLE